MVTCSHSTDHRQTSNQQLIYIYMVNILVPYQTWRSLYLLLWTMCMAHPYNSHKANIPHINPLALCSTLHRLSNRPYNNPDFFLTGKQETLLSRQCYFQTFTITIIDKLREHLYHISIFVIKKPYKLLVTWKIAKQFTDCIYIMENHIFLSSVKHGTQ